MATTLGSGREEVEMAHTLVRGYDDLSLIVLGEIEPFVPGRLWGRPEFCCPDEGGYVVISGILTEDRKPWDGELTPAEESAVEEALESFVDRAWR